MQELISTIASFGAIGVFTAGVVFTFSFLDKKQALTKNRLIAFVVACCVLTVICVLCLLSEASKSQEKSQTELLGRLVSQTFMQPYADADGNYKYNFMPGNGLELECKENEVFNKFNSKDAVSSMWADPDGAWVKAALSDGQLQVEFVRKGYGVDVILI